VPITGVGGQGPLLPTADSYAQLQDSLKARRVTSQRLETLGDSGEWRFWCAVPKVDNPNIRHVYEAKVAGENGLAAVRAVLEQIDHDAKDSSH
jgi:hypothetical protein